jgi:hypothetical protein
MEHILKEKVSHDFRPYQLVFFLQLAEEHTQLFFYRTLNTKCRTTLKVVFSKSTGKHFAREILENRNLIPVLLRLYGLLCYAIHL